jgi:exosome complex RNA-binding protein Rrp4
MAFKGTHNVQSHGSRAWQQRLRVSPNQRVVAGSLLVANSKSLKSGENTYLRKHNIHAKINGVIEIKDKKINIKPAVSKASS